MSDLPDRPVAPLSAPPGSFERVLRRAHARRVRTGLLASTAVLVATLGTVGAGLALTGDSGRQSLVATQPSSTASPVGTATPVATPSAVPTPTAPVLPDPSPTAGAGAATATPMPTAAAATAAPPSPSAPAVAAPSEAVSDYRGRAVDADGRPLAELHVTLWSPGNALPDEHDAFTGADGRFTVPCGERALLLDWMLGGAQPASTRDLAATWVGGGATLASAPALPCDGQEHVTVLRPGAVLEGAYRGTDGGGTLPLPAARWTPGSSCLPLGTYDGRGPTQPTCVELSAVGGRYRVVGLPTGTYVVRTATGEVSVSLTAGRTTTRDLDDCASCPPEQG